MAMYKPMTAENEHELLDEYYDFVTKLQTVKMKVKNDEGEVPSTACNQAISDIRTVRDILCNIIDKPAATPE